MIKNIDVWLFIDYRKYMEIQLNYLTLMYYVISIKTKVYNDMKNWLMKYENKEKKWVQNL